MHIKINGNTGVWNRVKQNAIHQNKCKLVVHVLNQASIFMKAVK